MHEIRRGSEEERAVLVSVNISVKDERTKRFKQDELKDLALSCSSSVVAEVQCNREKPDAALYIGKGKVQQVSDEARRTGADVVIFDNELSGSQQMNLEELIGVKTIDRVQLILDVFARHARTQAGKTQVELAQLEYMLPRLRGKGVILSRLGGGIGTKGPGEQKLEVDRRRIQDRIIHLKKQLEGLRKKRALARVKRTRSHVPLVGLVGYTNAGKSTLLNALTDARQETRSAMFTTLDPLARMLILPNHQKLVLSDTVGFIRDLPERLIEAFQATLEELEYTDILLHVLDITSPDVDLLYSSVEKILIQLGLTEKPTIIALNKKDLLEDKGLSRRIQAMYPASVVMSAKKGEGLDDLKGVLIQGLAKFFRHMKLRISFKRMDLVDLIHSEADVLDIQYTEDGIVIDARLDTILADRLKKYEI